MEQINDATIDQQTERKTYVVPTLIDFGSCAEITQGTFTGLGVDNANYS